jgi:hypothetical protein
LLFDRAVHCGTHRLFFVEGQQNKISFLVGYECFIQSLIAVSARLL